MRRLASLLILSVLVVGPPPALLSIGFYAWDQLNIWSPADFRLLLALLTVMAWGAWGVFVLSALLEAVRMLTSGRVAVRLPGLTWVQGLASGLLMAALTTSGPSLSAMAAPLPDAPRHVLVTTDDAPPAVAGDASATAGRTQSSVVTHVVKQGDDLWSLAERYYGTGAKWRSIVEQNAGVLTGDPVRELQVGVRLSISKPLADHTVQRGETLWAIAEESLGHGARYPELQRLNADRIGDPDHIEVGWMLHLPADAEAAPASGSRAEAGDGRSPTPPSTAGAARTTQAPLRPSVAAGSIGDPPPAAATTAPTASPTAAILPSAAAPPASAEAATPPTPANEEASERQAPDSAAVRALGGGLAALAASGILVGLLARRRGRAGSRDLGRTFVPAPADLQRFETVLGLIPEPVEQSASREVLVARAMRTLAQHWWTSSEPAGQLRRAVLDDQRLTFQFLASLPTVPAGFEPNTDVTELSVEWSHLESWEEPHRSVAFPALVTLGRDQQDRLVMVDLARWGVLAIDAEEGSLRVTPVSAMIVELACSPWADELSLRVVTPDPAFVAAAAVQEVRCAEAGDAVAELEQQALERGALLDLADADYDAVRLDPDRADAWAPLVCLFEQTPPAATVHRLNAALDKSRVGIAAVVPQAPDVRGTAASVAARLQLAHGESEQEALAVLEPEGLRVTAQTLQPATREAIASLYRGSVSGETLPASWWREEELGVQVGDGHEGRVPLQAGAPEVERPQKASDPQVDREGGQEGERRPEGKRTPDPSAIRKVPVPGEGRPSAVSPLGESRAPRALAVSLEDETGSAAPGEPAEVVTLHPLRRARAPRLRLFGVVTLEGAQGEPPQKAGRRCLEYCAWLMEHPGATASEMTSALFVTDGTRRSNLSRLRAWLGQGPAGPYLPEAYSGRISLHPAVTSDWAELRHFVAHGVNVTPPARLRAALALVAGAPLSDAAPGEWAWADRLRTEMCETVRDVAVVLARAERVRGQLDAARWACERGLLAAPDDELLACELMLVADTAGQPDEVRRLARALERSTARQGGELRRDTVDLIQRLVEGRRRPVLDPTGSDS